LNDEHSDSVPVLLWQILVRCIDPGTPDFSQALLIMVAAY
jgi:hypothetical protein